MIWILAVAVGLATFVLRFGTAQFPIDHFVHLTGGLMIVHGELPVRDFLDAGRPLQYFASAAVIWLFGPDLFGEALLCAVVIGVAAAVQLVVCFRLSRSLPLSLALTGLAILGYPRLYSYPKIVCYVLAVAVMIGLMARPGWKMAAALGGITGIALLLRADHGVYIGIASLVLAGVSALERRALPRRCLYAYVAAFGITVAPFAAWVTLNGGIVAYATTVAEYQADNRRFETIPSHLAYGTLRFPPEFTLDFTAPLIGVAPPPEATRTIGIRWADDVSSDERRALESRNRLLNGRYLGSGQWEYDSVETTPEAIRALLTDRRLETVTHVDLATGELTSAPRNNLLSRLYELAPFLRFRVLPGAITASNAAPFLFYLALTVPLFALALMARDIVARRLRGADGDGLALPAAVTVMCLLALVGMLRVPIVDRIPDVLPIVGILSAWIIGKIRQRPGAPGSAAWWRPTPWRIGLACLLALATMSVLVVSTLPTVTVTKLRDTRSTLAWLRGHPNGSGPAFSLTDSEWLPDDHHGARAITTYLRACLRPDDRVLLAWYAPDIPFAANRLPAGDQVFILPGFWSTARRQFTTLEHMLKQRVPIVVARSTRYADFRLAFDILDMHINERYRFAREFTPPNSPIQFRVFTDPAYQPTGTHQPLDLPCFS